MVIFNHISLRITTHIKSIKINEKHLYMYLYKNNQFITTYTVLNHKTKLLKKIIAENNRLKIIYITLMPNRKNL